MEHIPKDEKLFWSLLAPLQRPVETFIRLEQGLHGQVYSECVKVICRLVCPSVSKPSDDHSTPGWYGGLPPEITGVHTDFLPPYPFHHNILRPSSLHPETASIIPKVIRLLMWNMLNCSFSKLMHVQYVPAYTLVLAKYARCSSGICSVSFPSPFDQLTVSIEVEARPLGPPT